MSPKVKPQRKIYITEKELINIIKLIVRNVFIRLDKHCVLKEDKQSDPLYVKFSQRINKEIDLIKDYNVNNPKGLKEWDGYLKILKNYISKPVNALDYTNKYPQWRNGSKYANELGFNFAYKILINSFSKQFFVYIIYLDYKLQDYNLLMPPALSRKKNNTTNTVSNNTVSNNVAPNTKELEPS